MQGTGVAAAALAPATFIGGPSAPSTAPPASASASPMTAAPADHRLTLQPSIAPGGVPVAVVATGLPTRSVPCTLLVDRTPTGSCSASAGTLTGSFTAPSGTGPTHDVHVCFRDCGLGLRAAANPPALAATLLVPTPALSPVPGAAWTSTSTCAASP